jgi:hypothetical protein
MVRVFAVLAALAAAAAVAAGVASASTATPVAVPTCFFVHGGGVNVPAGNPVELRATWVAKNLGLVVDFLNAVTASASIDGIALANPTNYFGGPSSDLVSGRWATRWSYSTSPLAVGQSMTVIYDAVVSHPVTDGLSTNLDGTPFLYTGSVYGGPVTCTVTGV